MKLALGLFFSVTAVPLFGAVASVNFAIGELRDASGTVISDGAGSWAIIVAGQLGNPPSAAVLPGGLEDFSSLGISDGSQILDDFAFQTLSAGASIGGAYVWAVGSINGTASGFQGVPLQTVAFDVYNPPSEPGFASGTLFGFYWFPSVALSGGEISLGSTFEIGGFANSSANAASNGAGGTVVPESGNVTVQFFETNFNQGQLGGGDTGLSVDRFTAVSVAVPEPASLTLSAIGLAALLRRRR